MLFLLGGQKSIDKRLNTGVYFVSMARNTGFPKTLTPAQQRIQQAALRLFAEKGMDNVNVRELAFSAGVARGTVYNNQQASIKDVFEQLASRLSDEMHERVFRTLAGVDNPVQRVANAMRFFVRRAHEERDWGAFIVRFGLNDDSLRQMWNGNPRKDVASGIAAGYYKLRADQLPGAMVMLACNTLGAMYLALHGHRGWRAAGSDAAELTLRAFGVRPQRALAAATAELSPLLRID